MLPSSSFVFAICQAGAETALKKEMARAQPGLRFAFSRPGFVTFKSDSPVFPELELGCVFARAWGASYGKVGTETAKIIEFARAAAADAPGGKLRLHVWQREPYLPGDEPPGHDPEAWARPARQALLEAGSELFHEAEKAEPGELVLDVICVEENEWWIGAHCHSGARLPFPGGETRIELPPEAPSRAYLKLEDALEWSQAPLRSGETALEIGSAPGGASYALLRRGLKVIGIDPGKMDPVVLKHPGYRHIAHSVTSLERSEVPEQVQWLLLDMNVKPQDSLRAVERVAAFFPDSLLGLLLTVKLNEWKLADEIPAYLERLRATGLARVRATQLASNRREIFVCGLTRRGATRQH